MDVESGQPQAIFAIAGHQGRSRNTPGRSALRAEDPRWYRSTINSPLNFPTERRSSELPQESRGKTGSIRWPGAAAFTLIELLVVIAIIAILTGMLFTPVASGELEETRIGSLSLWTFHLAPDLGRKAGR